VRDVLLPIRMAAGTTKLVHGRRLLERELVVHCIDGRQLRGVFWGVAPLQDGEVTLLIEEADGATATPTLADVAFLTTTEEPLSPLQAAAAIRELVAQVAVGVERATGELVIQTDDGGCVNLEVTCTLWP